MNIPQGVKLPFLSTGLSCLLAFLEVLVADDCVSLWIRVLVPFSCVTSTEQLVRTQSDPPWILGKLAYLGL